MYRKIVVGWDGTEAARDALALAGMLRAPDGTVTAACVYAEPGPPGRPAAQELAPDGVGTRDHAEELLAVAQAAVPADTAWLETVAIRGRSAADGLCALADDRSASLLAVGSSRYGPPGQVHAGATGRRLLVGPPCPLAFSPKDFGQPPEPRIVAVAFDGHHQLAAVYEGAELAESLGAALRLVCVMPALPRWARVVSEDDGYDWSEVHSHRLTEFRELLDQAALGLAKPPAAALLLEGRPVPEMLSEVGEGVDLFVIGRPASGALQRVLAGVTAGAIPSAPCPVLVIPGQRTEGRLARQDRRVELASA